MERPRRGRDGPRRGRAAPVPVPDRRRAGRRLGRRGRRGRDPRLPHCQHPRVPALRAPRPRRGRPPRQGDRRPRLQRACLRPRHLAHPPALQPPPPEVPHAPGGPAGRGPLGARELGRGPRHHRRALSPDSRGGRQPGVPRDGGDRQLVHAVDRRAGTLLRFLEPLRRSDADHLPALLRLGQLRVQRDLRRRALGVPRRVGPQPLLPGLGQQPRGVQPGLHEEPLRRARRARRAAGNHRSAAERDGGPLRPVDPDPAWARTRRTRSA